MDEPVSKADIHKEIQEYFSTELTDEMEPRLADPDLAMKYRSWYVCSNSLFIYYLLASRVFLLILRCLLKSSCRKKLPWMAVASPVCFKESKAPRFLLQSGTPTPWNEWLLISAGLQTATGANTPTLNSTILRNGAQINSRNANAINLFMNTIYSFCFIQYVIVSWLDRGEFFLVGDSRWLEL